MTSTIINHGVSGYKNYGCRCDECREARTAYDLARRSKNRLPKLLVEPEEWMAKGQCRGTSPDLFHPERGESTATAKEICAHCTVKAECLDYALRVGIKVGVYGGMSERERRAERRRRVKAAAA